MDPSTGEGGTKLQKKQKADPQSSPQMNMGPPKQQMAPHSQQSMDQQQMQQQQMHQQQMYQQQMQQQQQMEAPPIQQIRQPPVPKRVSFQRDIEQVVIPTPREVKSRFGNSSGSDIKNSLIVVLLFVILNSKIMWKQISRLPLMGKVEPSMIALIVNSLLAGLMFFLIKTFLVKN